MSISYLKGSLGINSFGVLVPNDAYGLGFQKVISYLHAYEYDDLRYVLLISLRMIFSQSFKQPQPMRRCHM